MPDGITHSTTQTAVAQVVSLRKRAAPLVAISDTVVNDSSFVSIAEAREEFNAKLAKYVFHILPNPKMMNECE